MNYNEVKLWMINMAVITITFTQIENILKLTLKSCSIFFLLLLWLIRSIDGTLNNSKLNISK